MSKTVFVQVCTSNPLARCPDLWPATGEVRCFLEEQACLDHCTICQHAPFALVDGKIIKGKAPAAVVTAAMAGALGQKPKNSWRQRVCRLSNHRVWR